MSNSNNSTRNTKLRTASNQVKNETRDDANTADRIGGLFLDMVDFDISDAGDVEIKNPTADQGLIYSNGKWRNSAIPGGGGGGEGTTGEERIFFLNRVHNDTPPTKPSVDNYQNDTFVVGNETWVSSNLNPASGYDTWAIFVWFIGSTSPSTIDGPIRIYNSASSGGGGGTGSNGEDGEEVEFIYCRSTTLWDSNTKNVMATALGEFINGGKRVETYAVIGGQYWYDHPQGIDTTNRHEYMAFRRSSLNSDGKRIWTSGFIGPYLWSSYGERGIDGDGIEYIYLVNTGTLPVGIDDPRTWSVETRGKDGKTFDQNEFIAEGSSWTDEPQDLEPGQIQWCSVRKKRIPEDSTDGTIAKWQSFSKPTVWGKYARDGVANGYVVSLTNALMPVGTDIDGNVTSYSNSCGVQVEHNGNPMHYSSSESAASLTDEEFGYTIGTISRTDPETIQENTITASKSGSIVNVSISNLTKFKQATAKIPITVILPGSAGTREQEITLYGYSGEKGNPGEDGTMIELYVSTATVKEDYYKNNTFPQAIQVGAKIGKGDSVNTYLVGTDDTELAKWKLKFYYYYDGDTENPTEVTGSITPVNSPKGTDSNLIQTLTVYMEMDGKLFDAQNINYIHEPAPGIGIDAIVYDIDVLYTTAFKNVNNKVTGGFRFTIKKTEGRVSWWLINDPSKGYIWIDDPTKSPDTTTYEKSNESIQIYMAGNNMNGYIGNSSHGEWNINPETTELDIVNNQLFSSISLISSTGMPLKTVVIPLIIEGPQGSSDVQAVNGVVVRMRSWNKLSEKDASAEGADKLGPIRNEDADDDGVLYKDVVLYETRYFYIEPSSTVDRSIEAIKSNPPIVKGNVNTDYGWHEIELMTDSAFQVMLAKYAFIENLTAREIVVTDADNDPKAGITSGKATSGSVAKDDYTRQLVPDIWRDSNTRPKEGNVRFWGGFDSSTGDLKKSKFYVTDEGFLHAENAEIAGTFTSLDGTAKVFQEETSTFPKRGFSVQTKNKSQTTAELFSSDWNTYDTGELFLKQVDANNNVVSNSLFYPFSWSINKGSGYGTGYNRVLISATGTQGEISLYSDEANSGSLNIKADGTISGNVSLPGNILTESSITLPSNPKTGMVIFAIFCNRVTSAKPIHLPSGTPIENYTQGFSFDYSAPLIFVYTGTFWQIFYCGT